MDPAERRHKCKLANFATFHIKARPWNVVPKPNWQTVIANVLNEVKEKAAFMN